MFKVALILTLLVVGLGPNVGIDAATDLLVAVATAFAITPFVARWLRVLVD